MTMADPRETLPFPPTDWTQSQILLGWGAILNAMLYLAGVFAMAAALNDRLAGILAIATAGATFLSYSFRLTAAGAWLQYTLHLGSWALGIAAGLSLLYTVIA
jgi:hypothetical protein